MGEEKNQKRPNMHTASVASNKEITLNICMFTCPNALRIGDAGGSWSPAQLSLGSSCLLSGCCCSLHDVTFLGSFWCNEFLFVKNKSHKMLTVSNTYFLITKTFKQCPYFNNSPCWFLLLSSECCFLLPIYLWLLHPHFLFLVLLRHFLVIRPLSLRWRR